MASNTGPRPEEDRMEYLLRRQEERRRHQQLSAFLVILAIVLIIGIIIFILSGGLSRFVSVMRTDAPGQVIEENQEQPTASDKYSTVTITAVGDIGISDEQIEDATGKNGVIDFSPAFLGAAALLGDSDLTVGNLEANFCGAPYSGSTGNAPEALAMTLSGLGFDLLQTANSYTIMNGMDGVSATISQIESAGMQAVGTFASRQARTTANGATLCEVNGIRVAFVAFTKGLNNMSLPEGGEYAVNLLYTDYDSTYAELDREGIVAAMQQVRKLQPDVIIALVHWGSEYESGVTQTQRTVEQLLYSNGASAILGTHSHITGPLEAKTFTSEDGTMRDVLTAFDLGSFYTSSTKSDSQISIILNLEFTKNHWTGKTVLSSYTYTPVYCVDNGAGAQNRYQVLNIANAAVLYNENYIFRVSDEIYQAIQEDLADLSGRIKPEPEE